MTTDEVVAFLRFWDRLPDATLKGDAALARRSELELQVHRLRDGALADFTETWRRRYEEQATVRSAVASRAAGLLVFTGVVTTGAALLATSFTGAAGWLIVLIIAVGAGLLYAAIAAGFLALRAQEVAPRAVPRSEVGEAADGRTLTASDAVEVMAAAEQDRSSLATALDYLAGAQKWALIALLLISLLAPLSLIAAMTKPAATTGGPSPTAGPRVTLPPLETEGPSAAPVQPRRT
jgi:hypothetical protein